MHTLRLFIALAIPQNLKERVSMIQEQLKEMKIPLKWVEKENFHLTLKFLGNVNVSLISAITTAVYSLASSRIPFDLSLGNLGVFPVNKNPRIIYINVGGQLSKLLELHRTIELALAPMGFVPEGRKFSPHLTLGRIKPGVDIQNITSKVDLLKQKDPLGNFTVNSVDLIQSQLTRNGPVYTVLKSISLGGAKMSPPF